MLDHTHHDSAADHAAAEPPPLHAFIEAHADALHDAALLLGGPDAARSVDEVVDHLGHEVRPCRRCRALLGELLDLLALEHVHDPDREEAARFAMIDPADPVVERICWLTDGLRETLGAQDAIDVATSIIIRRAA